MTNNSPQYESFDPWDLAKEPTRNGMFARISIASQVGPDTALGQAVQKSIMVFKADNGTVCVQQEKKEGQHAIEFLFVSFDSKNKYKSEFMESYRDDAPKEMVNSDVSRTAEDILAKL